ncbi:cation diffusion facilitator family transporter [Natroniella sulfidigena]|uniref:cation diffusion facilitator family transporter n=1 Tax=Natroniella sulfidigena TaxID=723921 RepID=UPI00200B71F6|nr:cation diffusion facilitator family transporter [Natroniella sulfidigena]MCK8817667.1 cation diffusion facilitator family transporter [Natroniella sulfidigena]
MEKTRHDVGVKVSTISLIVNILLSVLKVAVGFWFGSKALIADGFHSISDVISTIIVGMSFKVSSQPPDDCHPYGHGKAESIATKLLGIILIITGLMLLRSTVLAIINYEINIPSSIVLWTAVISIAIKEGLCRYIIKIGREIDSKGLVADAYHHRSDALSSIAVLIGAGGARLGYPLLDPLAGLVVASFIIKVGGEVVLDAIDELMDAIPSQDKKKQIIKEAEKVDSVITIKDVKLRAYGSRLFIDLKVVVANDLTVIEGHQVADDIKEKIKSSNPKVEEVLVHVDPEDVIEHLVDDEN